MILEGYGIRLIRMREEHIELVRQHRNSANIRRFMEYRDEITPEMQLAWFKSVDNIENNYFMIETDGKFIGLINAGKIDWDKRETGNGGIFIWEVEYWETLVPLSASVLLTETSLLFGIDRSYVKILKDNPKAIAFNKQLGYELMPNQEAEYNQMYELTTDRFVGKLEKLKQMIPALQAHEQMVITVDDPEHPVSKFLGSRAEEALAANRYHAKLVRP